MNKVYLVMEYYDNGEAYEDQIQEHKCIRAFASKEEADKAESEVSE